MSTLTIAAAPAPAAPVGELKETAAQKRWRVTKTRIAEGKCRDCGQDRTGDGATNERCGACAEKARAYLNDYRVRRVTGQGRPAKGGIGARVYMGDLVARATMPSPGNADPAEYVTPSGVRLTLTAQRTEHPSVSAEEAAPWSTAHWSCTMIARSPKGQRVGRRIGPVPISLGAGYREQPPAILELLSLLLQDAADATDARDFDDWCARVGLSTDSRRAERLYKLALRRAGALSMFLNKRDLAQLKQWLIPKRPAAAEGVEP